MQKERIKVYARIKPQKTHLLQNQAKEILYKEDDQIVVDFRRMYKLNIKSTLRKYEGKQKFFKLDNVFCTNSHNEQIFNITCKDIVNSSLRGINSTVFLYGQTGSGKTFTMIGKKVLESSKTSIKSLSPLPNRQTQSEICYLTQNQDQIEPLYISQNGILKYSLKEFFDQIENCQIQEQFYLTCSYIEIYKEKIYDLLQDKVSEDQKLILYYEENTKEFRIKNSTKINLTSFEQAQEVLKKGEYNRRYAKTNLNHNSSRSHVIFRVFIKYIDSNNQLYQSVCNFVDLAGSERISNFKYMTEQDMNSRINESKSINKSLFFLTQVIDMKSKQLKSSHIPYRNSVLTKILKNSIGGNAKTAIILCLDSCFNNLEQSLSTLKFGKLAQNIENQIVRNQVVQNEIGYLEQIYFQKVENMMQTRQEGIEKNKLLEQRLDKLNLENLKLKRSYKNLMLLKKDDKENVENSEQNIKIKVSKKAGDLFYYSQHQSNQNQNVFQDRSLLEQILKDQILKSKNKIIRNYKTELMVIGNQLVESNLKSEKLKEQIKCQDKLIDFLLNIDLDLYKYFDKDIKEKILQNALKSIENQKIQILNDNSDQKLSYNLNKQENLSKQLLMEKIVNQQEMLQTEFDTKNEKVSSKIDIV